MKLSYFAMFFFLFLLGACDESENGPQGLESSIIYEVDVEALSDCGEEEPRCSGSESCTIFPEDVGPKCHEEDLEDIASCSDGYSLAVLESSPIQVRCEAVE